LSFATRQSSKLVGSLTLIVSQNNSNEVALLDYIQRFTTIIIKGLFIRNSHKKTELKSCVLSHTDMTHKKDSGSVDACTSTYFVDIIRCKKSWRGGYDIMKKCKKIASMVLLFCLMVFSSVACDYKSETGDSSNSATTTVSTTTKSTSVEKTQASTIEDIPIATTTETASTEIAPTETTSTEVATTETNLTEVAATEATLTEEPTTKSSSSTTTVTVPAEAETGDNLVWVPTKGGKKYHSKSACSGMKDPIQVSKDTAVADGYTPCGKCYK
jgi:hypothetical protein